jgi:hypothetical protein
VAGRTQEALYADIALDLSWSEDELPQVERTKHVHSLHPYLGKFIPQLAEFFLRQHFEPGETVYDPFVGSGTTLVEANVLGIQGVGTDVSAFNCLLSSVKTSSYSLARVDLALRGLVEEVRRDDASSYKSASAWLRDWYSPNALGQLLSYRAASERLPESERAVASIVLSRSARSARQTAHYDLDFPRQPIRDAYYCHKHKRVCRPVDEALKFLQRYTADTTRRLRAFDDLATDAATHVLHADARSIDLPLGVSGVLTSPPYPGLIDYHEQHRYAYELLGLPSLEASEIGAATSGRSRAALQAYVDGMVEVFTNAARHMAAGSPVIVVVNDSQNLYPAILSGSNLVLEERLTRHVNRRTGRRAGEFFEDILICRTR